jgi:hypothetical protein
MAIKNRKDKYVGPTVGQKLHILEAQVELMTQSLEDIKERTDCPDALRLAIGALKRSKWISEQWQKWQD